MRGATDDNASTQTVDSGNGSKIEGGAKRSRWSKAGGGWQKGSRIEGENSDDEQEPIMRPQARWSFNVGSVRHLDIPDDDDDDEEEESEMFAKSAVPKIEEEEEDSSAKKAEARWSFNPGSTHNPRPDDDDDDDEENDMWGKSAVPRVVEEDDSDDSDEASFGEDASSPITPPKPVKEKVEPPKNRYVPSPVVPKKPTISKKVEDEDIPEPKRMYMELCGETCEREFKEMSKEAMSPRSLRKKKALDKISIKKIDSSSELSLSLSRHKRPSVRNRMRKEESRRTIRRSSIEESLRNLNC